METKVCTRCKQEKNISEFVVKKNGKFHSWCTPCRLLANKEWRLSHEDHVKEYKEKTKEQRDAKAKEYRETHREELRLISSKYNEIKKEERKNKRKDPAFRAHRKEYEKQWRKENRERYNAYFKVYHDRDVGKKIARNMRNRARKVLTGVISSIHSADMFGCDLEFFKNHLASQFTEGMTWDNYGFGADKWNVHHTPPLASYDFTDPAQQKEAFLWYHCSPKWTPDNISENSWFEGKRRHYKK